MSTGPRRTGRARRRPRQRLPEWARGAATLVDELDGVPVEVRSIQPYQALKPYRCPGCHATIAPGVGHLVVVPLVDPDDRRHWHRSCWARRHRRLAR